MLRRKLMFFLASLLALMLIVSFASVYVLQRVLARMDHAALEDGAVLPTAHNMTDSITSIEIELREVQLGHSRHLDTLLDRIETLRTQTADFGAQYQRPIPEARPGYEAIQKSLETFDQHVATLATVEDQALAREHTAQAISASVTLRQEILGIARTMREHTAAEERSAITLFRWIVLGIALGFLIVINTSFFVIYRMSTMVTAPVEQLVAASRRLAREDYACRVSIASKDEFNELAAAYNQLAERLQVNERRKLETLTQTAIMLNHELNNAGAIIKLQLQLLARQSGGNPAFERGLRQIHQSLDRMTQTVESLKRVRRIVLTEYTQGTQMLDLAKSTQDAEEPLAHA
ncbi:MAG TPA: HAMP domain-containing protein [Phycisphaerae bacterium]|nr:HAMP domain-containing protein [Phycisphaerae bacterium]